MPPPPPGAGGPPAGGHNYPLTFAVDFPDRNLDRLSTALRIFWIIPIVILAATIVGGSYAANSGGRGAAYVGGGIGVLFIPVVLFFLTIGAWIAAIVAWFAILFTGRYPPFSLQP